MRPRLLIGLVLSTLFVLTLAPTALAQGPGGDRFLIGQDFTLESGDTLYGNLAAIGGSLEIEPESVVDGDVALLGGRLQVAGTVRGDVVVFGGSVELAESAIIDGSLAAFGSSVTRAPGAHVEGELYTAPQPSGWPELGPSRLPPLVPGLMHSGQSGAWSILWWCVSAMGWSLLMALLAGAVVLLAPRGAGRVASAVAIAPLLSFLVGSLTIVLATVVGLILLICCCLGLLLWMITAAAILFGWVAVGLWTGQKLLEAFRIRDVSSFLEAALGALLIAIASRLPFCIGGLFGLSVTCIGLGAVLLTRFGTHPYPSRVAAITGVNYIAGESAVVGTLPDDSERP